MRLNSIPDRTDGCANDDGQIGPPESEGTAESISALHGLGLCLTNALDITGKLIEY